MAQGTERRSPEPEKRVIKPPENEVIVNLISNLLIICWYMEVYVGIWRYIYDSHNIVTILFDTFSQYKYPNIE